MNFSCMNSSSLLLVCVNSWLPLGLWQWVLQLKYTLYEELLPFICFILNLPPASFVWCSLVSLLKERTVVHYVPVPCCSWFCKLFILSLVSPSWGWRFWRVFRYLSPLSGPSVILILKCRWEEQTLSMQQGISTS